MKKLFLLSLCFFTASVFAEECKDVLVLGFVTKTHIQKTDNTIKNVLDWLRSDRFQEYASSSSGGFGISLPIEGVNISFGANSSDSSYSKLKDSIDKGNSSYYNNAFALSVMKQVVDPNVVKAWADCMKANSPGNPDALGLQGSITNEMGNNFFLNLRWVARLNITNAIVNTVSISGATCEDLLKKGLLIGTEGHTFLCVRTGNEPVSLSINLKGNRGAYKATLDKKVKPTKSLKELCSAGDKDAYPVIDELVEVLKAQVPPEPAKNDPINVKLAYRKARFKLQTIEELPGAVGRLAELNFFSPEDAAKEPIKTLLAEAKMRIRDLFSNYESLLLDN